MASMSYRQLGGWALLGGGLISAVLALLMLFNVPASDALRVVQLVATLLVIVGLPAIQLTQPTTGQLGWLGIGLMELAAVIAFIVVSISWLTSADIPSAVPFISALAGLAGYVLVGYLTIRAHIFPAWTGWALAAVGVVNFAAGLLPASAALAVIAGLFALAGAVAIAGYGWSIVQRPQKSDATPSAA